MWEHGGAANSFLHARPRSSWSPHAVGIAWTAIPHVAIPGAVAEDLMTHGPVWMRLAAHGIGGVDSHPLGRSMVLNVTMMLGLVVSQLPRSVERYGCALPAHILDD